MIAQAVNSRKTKKTLDLEVQDYFWKRSSIIYDSTEKRYFRIFWIFFAHCSILNFYIFITEIYKNCYSECQQLF